MKKIRISMSLIAVLVIVFSAITYVAAPKWEEVSGRSNMPAVVTIDQIEKDFGVTVAMPSIEWVQRRLGCEKIDGRLGDSYKTSETQQKWDALQFNQYAARYFTNK